MLFLFASALVGFHSFVELSGEKFCYIPWSSAINTEKMIPVYPKLQRPITVILVNERGSCTVLIYNETLFVSLYTT